MTAGRRQDNTFCWINIISPDLDKARAFYSELFGWVFTDHESGGFGIAVDGKPVGAIFDQNDPATPEGTPVHIGVMIKVASADAVAEKVKLLGGTARDPFEVFDAGRMSVCQDPTGAKFDIWEPRAHHGTDGDSMVHGAPNWIEVLTNDTEKASSFYADLFGWLPTVTPGPPEYTTFRLGDQPVAGMLKITPEMGNVDPNWGTYMKVKDVDETAALAEKLGATLCIPPRDIPDIGRFCAIRSPQGVFFYAITYLPRMTE